MKLKQLPETPQQLGVAREVLFGIGPQHHLPGSLGENLFWNIKRWGLLEHREVYAILLFRTVPEHRFLSR